MRKCLHVCCCSIAKLFRGDPQFLEREFLCINVWGFPLLILSHFSQISHENEIIWSHETKLFHFHRIFKKWRGVRVNPIWICHCYYSWEKDGIRARETKNSQFFYQILKSRTEWIRLISWKFILGIRNIILLINLDLFLRFVLHIKCI